MEEQIINNVDEQKIENGENQNSIINNSEVKNNIDTAVQNIENIENKNNVDQQQSQQNQQSTSFGDVVVNKMAADHTQQQEQQSSKAAYVDTSKPADETFWENLKDKQQNENNAKEVLKLRAVNLGLRNQLKQMNDKLDQILQQRRESEEELDQLKSNQVDPKIYAKKLNAELDTAYKKIDNQEKEIKSLRDIKDNLTAQRMTKLENRITERTKLLKEAQEKIKLFEKNEKMLQKTIEEVEEQRDGNSTMNALFSQIEGYKEIITDLKDQLDKKEKQARKSMDLNVTLEDKYRKLCKQVGILPKNNTQYIMDKKADQIKINQYIKSTKQNCEDAEEYQHKCEELQRKVYMYESKLSKLEKESEKQIKNLKEELKESKEKQNDAETILYRKESTFMVQEKTTKDLQRQLNKLKRMRSQSTQEFQNNFVNMLNPNLTADNNPPPQLSKRQIWNQKEQNKKDFKGNLTKATQHFSDSEVLIGQKGRIIAVTVWNNGKQINGIQFTYQLQYSIGEFVGGKHYEQNGGETNEDNFKADKEDFIKTCKCSLNENGFIDGICFKTKRNKEYKVGKMTKTQLQYNIDFLETPGAAFGGLCVEDGGQSQLCYLGFEIRKDFHQQVESPMKNFLGKQNGNSPFKRRESKPLQKISLPGFSNIQY